MEERKGIKLARRILFYRVFLLSRYDTPHGTQLRFVGPATQLARSRHTAILYGGIS
jgi:hypothetical protein